MSVVHRCPQCGSRHVQRVIDFDDDGIMVGAWYECQACFFEWTELEPPCEKMEGKP